MSDKMQGMYDKFLVARNDHKDELGQKHYGCKYFVLDLTHDKYAMAAMLAYAKACRKEYPSLADDIEKMYENVAVEAAKGGTR